MNAAVVLPKARSESMNELWRIHSAGLRRFALKLTQGNEHRADEVIQELEQDGPTYDVIIDAVGGAPLGTAIGRIAPSGTIISFASTTDEPVSYPTRTLFARAPGARLYGLFVFPEIAKHASGTSDLRRLAELVAAGKLDPQIDLVASWTQVAGAIEALLDRRVNGKAVLTVD